MSPFLSYLWMYFCRVKSVVQESPLKKIHNYMEKVVIKKFLEKAVSEQMGVLKTELRSLLEDAQLCPKEVLTSDEAAAFLGVSKSNIYKLTMGRKIPYYKSQGGKLCYFDRQEIIGWMKAHRVSTQEELDAKARGIAKKGGER